MSESLLAQLITLLAAVVGYVARPLGDGALEWVRHRRHGEAETDARRRERLEALQSAMSDVLANGLVMISEKGMAFLGERDEARTKARVAEVRASALGAVVDDAELGKLVSVFSRVAQDWLAETMLDSTAFQLVREAYDNASRRLGELLRDERSARSGSKA